MLSKIIPLLALLAALSACSAVKTTCAVIDVAHTACEYVTVEYLDDDGKLQRQNVPARVLRDAALNARGGGEDAEAP